MGKAKKIPNLLHQYYRFPGNFIIVILKVFIDRLQQSYPLGKNQLYSPMKLDSHQKLPSKHFDSCHYIYLRINSNTYPMRIHCLYLKYLWFQNQNTSGNILYSIHRIHFFCIGIILFGIELISLDQHLSCPMKYETSYQCLRSTH